MPEANFSFAMNFLNDSAVPPLSIHDSKVSSNAGEVSAISFLNALTGAFWPYLITSVANAFPNASAANADATYRTDTIFSSGINVLKSFRAQAARLY